jgi:Cu/Ag efflux pump CusA
VWPPPPTRGSVDGVRDFLLDAPNGGRVRLAEVADVRIAPTPNKIKRENNSRRIDVHANVRGRDLGSVAEEVDDRLETLEFPIGYYPQLLGEYAEREAALKNFRILTIAVVIAIFLILQTTFRSWRIALLAFLTFPAALVGAVLAAFATDRVISLGSLVGLITILGLSARNGIMLIEHYRHLERQEGEPFGLALILRGASERLSPILMTAGCAVLALVPVLVAGSIPGYEIEYPLAVVIVGGVITSTLLSLFITPLLYLRFGRKSDQTVHVPATAATA